MAKQPRNFAASTHLKWFSTAFVRCAVSGSPRFPSSSIMMRRLSTPLSLQRCFIAARYFRSVALSLKNWLTYSSAWMPKSLLATLAKSRWSICPANSALWNDHSASEIWYQGLLAGNSLSRPPREARPTAAAARVDCSRKRRRSIGRVMADSPVKEGSTARSHRARRELVEEQGRGNVARRQVPHSHLREHEGARVPAMVEADHVPELMNRQHAHVLGPERLPAGLERREGDEPADQVPVSIPHQIGLPGALSFELGAPLEPHLGGGGVGVQVEAHRHAGLFPATEGVPHRVEEGRLKVRDHPGGEEHPHRCCDTLVPTVQHRVRGRGD